MPSNVGAESVDFGADVPISDAEFTEAIKKLLGDKNLEVDEIRLEFLKALL